MRHNTAMLDTEFTLQTSLTAKEVETLTSVAPFRVEPQHGLFKPFFATSDERDQVSEALQAIREALPL